MEKQRLYEQLLTAFTKAYPEKDGKTKQLIVSKIWKEMKIKYNSHQLPDAVKQQVQVWTGVCWRCEKED